MKRIAIIRNPPAAKPGVYIDLGAFQEHMKTGVKRVAAFLGYASHTTKGEPLSSVRLAHPIVFDFGIPDKIPEAERAGYQAEYRRWVIGLALTEIDQTYHRYVVSGLQGLEDIDSYHKTGALADPIKEPQNTWEAHKEFYKRNGVPLGQNLEASWLKTLKDARNCLAHGSGVVYKKHLTEGDKMPVRWMGSDMYQVDPKSGKRKLVPRDQPKQVLAEDVGQPLRDVDVNREHIYYEGDRINFSDADLAEILFFYKKLGLGVALVLEHKLKARIRP